MTIKKLSIPEDVQFVDMVTKQPLGQRLSFRDFLCKILLADPRWSNSSAMKSFHRIEQEVTRALSTDRIANLDDFSVKLLKAICSAPTHQITTSNGIQTFNGFYGFTSVGAVQLLPFIEAIEAADASI